MFHLHSRKIVISKVFVVDFICSYNVGNYPFDAQSCSGKITMKENDKRFFQVFQGNISYNGVKDLPSYTVEEVKLKQKVLVYL